MHVYEQTQLLIRCYYDLDTYVLNFILHN